MGGIFLIHDGNEELIEMKEQGYDSEDLLQTLLAKYPNLLAGDQIDSKSPRKWLLITREASLPSEEDGAGRWSVDHLFLDQDGIPTLVEVKRSSDTRIRREVVGQMLDYAANAVAYWSISQIRAKYEANCDASDIDPDETLADFLDGQFEADDYWSQVKTNLEAGRIRMLFVADKIPRELQRIIEFMNQQMNPAEVLGLEIKQYANVGVHTLVPRVIGQTTSAQDRKAGGSISSRQWDEESFFADLESRSGVDESAVARQILDWAKNRGLYFWWGKGNGNGSFFPSVVLGDGRCLTVSVWSAGTIRFQFKDMQKYKPFDSESTRLELLSKLNSIPNVRISDDGIYRRPSVLLSAFTDPKLLRQLIEILDCLVDELIDAN
jgi:hypothetical protein